METKTSLLDATLAPRGEADEKSTSHWSGLMERTAKLRWFLTPARLAVSLILFSLGIWSHSVYDSRVMLQNTQLLEQQLSRANQHIGLLTTRLTASEAQLAGVQANFENRLSLVGEQLRATQEDITSSQRTIQQLKVKQARDWQQLQQEFSRAERLDNARLNQLRWETRRTFSVLARQVDAARDQTVEANRTIEATNQEVAVARTIQGIHTKLIDHTHRELGVLRRRSDYAYFRFDIDAKNHPQSVANIRVELKKTDVKKQRYNVNLYVGDTKIKKKNRAANELIAFTVGDEKRPYQLVVRQVARDRIVGYLGVPERIHRRVEPASQFKRNQAPRRVEGQ